MDKIGITQPEWINAQSMEDALEFVKKFEYDIISFTHRYPVLIRPSYVLSGAAMNVAHNEDQLRSFLSMAAEVSPEHPTVISKFINGAQELDIDAVALKGDLLIYAISQHIENAGIISSN